MLLLASKISTLGKTKVNSMLLFLIPNRACVSANFQINFLMLHDVKISVKITHLSSDNYEHK